MIDRAKFNACTSRSFRGIKTNRHTDTQTNRPTDTPTDKIALYGIDICRGRSQGPISNFAIKNVGSACQACFTHQALE